MRTAAASSDVAERLQHLGIARVRQRRRICGDFQLARGQRLDACGAEADVVVGQPVGRGGIARVARQAVAERIQLRLRRGVSGTVTAYRVQSRQQATTGGPSSVVGAAMQIAAAQHNY